GGGDIRRVGKGDSTAIRTARNVIPAKAACNHLFHASRRCLKKTSRATSTARKGNVRTTASVPRTARDSLLHSSGRRNSGAITSSTNAGTIRRIGNGSGTMWVMFWYTGPSLGDAGNRGRTHISSSTNRE